MDNENQTKSSISTIPQWIFKTLFASLMIIIPFKQCCQMENLATSHCGFKIFVFYQKFSYIRKMKKGLKTSQWQNSLWSGFSSICFAHSSHCVCVCVCVCYAVVPWSWAVCTGRGLELSGLSTVKPLTGRGTENTKTITVRLNDDTQKIYNNYNKHTHTHTFWKLELVITGVYR